MKNTLKIVALVLVLTIACIALFSCGAPNKDPEKAKAALEAENYRINDITDNYIHSDDYEGLVEAFEARGGVGTNIKELDIFYFETAEDADEAWDDLQHTIELAEECSWSPDTFTSGKSGNIIFFGNKELIKIAK